MLNLQLLKTVHRPSVLLSRVLRKMSLFLFLGSVISTSAVEHALAAERDSKIDTHSPVIKHQKFTQPLPGNAPVSISANVTDDAGVQSVILYYRNSSDGEYRSMKMFAVSDKENDYRATIPANEVFGNKIEYYIQSTDVNGNTVTRAGRQFPLVLSLQEGRSNASSDSDEVVIIEDEPENEDLTWLWVIGGLVIAALIAANEDDDKEFQGQVSTPF